MKPETRFGVRVIEPGEMRSVARIAGLSFLVYAIGNGLVGQLARDAIVRDNLPSWFGMDVHSWIGVVTAAFAVTFCIAGAAPDFLVSRFFAPATIIGFLYAAAVLPLVMWIDKYPTSGILAIGYGVVGVLAFYLFARWAASLFAALVVAGQWWLDSVSDTPWPTWMMPMFVALLMVAAGYFIGRLIQQLSDLNVNLEAKVAEQVGEIERFSRLRRFLSAPVAEAVLSSDATGILAPHRREIAVMFCDLRGFTAFTKRVEPEEVIEVLDAYYAAAGEQITRFQATLGSFEGDGLMAYLNDPNPCEAPATRIVEMGLAIANALDELTPTWSSRGFDLGYGIGMAFGHATLGAVGFDGRSDYTALGTVVNLSARLCGTAGARELVVDHRIFLEAQGEHGFTALKPRELKGFGEVVPAYLVVRR